MKRNMILAAGVALALSSCSTIQHTSQVAGVDTNVYNLTVADMNVGKQKQTKTTEWKWNPLSTVSLKSQKETATAQLLEETNADVLVEPQYIVKRRGLFRGGSLTVTGYPATYSNFRTMTAEDAEMLAKLSGQCTDTVIAFAYPVINTSVERPARKPRKRIVAPSIRRNEPVKHKFLSVFGGPLYDAEYDFDSGFNAGLMFGKYGRRWGWYGKVSVTHATMERYDYRKDIEHKDKQTGPLVTFGAIKTLSRNWNCFMGLGLGGSITSKEYHYYNGTEYEMELRFAVPLELGFQWNFSNYNIMAGCTYALPVKGDQKGNIAPFVGIGYSF